jgi:hypothetical protein
MYAVWPMTAADWSELPAGRRPIACAAPVRGSTMRIVSISETPVPPPNRYVLLPIFTAAES